MSTITIPDSCNLSGYTQGANGAPGGTGTLTPETTDQLIARAKDIIAGRIMIPPMVTPPWVEEFLKREFEDKNPPPTPEAIRFIEEQLILDAQYGGAAVLCFRTPNGYLVALASGQDEIYPVLKGLTLDEVSQVIIEYTDPV